jgi:hypothetical protein
MRARSPDRPGKLWREIVKRKQQISEAEQQRRARQRAMSVAQYEYTRQRGMSIPQFCQRYSVGRTTAYGEIRAKRLRARKVRKRTIIGDDDAEDWFRHLPEAVQ